mgnify:CR=1 FL=1
MKIFIKTIPRKLNIKSISEYNIKTIQKKYIYSLEGIFCLHNDTFKKITIQDNDYSTITINNIELICDNSKTISKSAIKLPFNYMEQDIVLYIYALRKNSAITFNIEMIDDEIKDIYFCTNDSSIEHFSIQEDIQFFLNTL